MLALPDLCPYCAGPAELDVLELYLDERAVILEACCEHLHDHAMEAFEDDPSLFGGFVQNSTGVPCKRVVSSIEGGLRFGSGGLVIDHGRLDLVPIEFADAKAWVTSKHRHNRSLTGWRWGHAVANGRDIVAVASVGRPVARMLDGDTIVEVNRVCVDEEVDFLAFNACSMLYGAAAREAKKRGFKFAITYTREGEMATTVRAAGWTPTHVTKIDRRGWSRDGRPRGAEDRCRKIRWERGLTKDARADVARRQLEPSRVAELTSP